MQIHSRRLVHVVIVGVFMSLALIPHAFAKVTVDGTAEQRTKIANWLSSSLDAIVSIDAQGVMTVGPDGNASATRLRSMCDDAAQDGTIVLEILTNTDETIEFGGWVPESTTDNHTKGKQRIDIADIEGIGNIFTENGLTPDAVLMHEITEVYAGLKGKLKCLTYKDAHEKHGETAEDELYAANGTKLFGGGVYPDGTVLRKYTKPDGTFIVVVYNPRAKPIDVQWYKEVVPCKTVQGIIAIPDPDPVVHRFTFDFANRQHSETTPFDTSISHPTGVAADLNQKLFVTEDLSGPDEVRVFSSAGSLVQTIVHPSLVAPTGIDVDLVTGDIFVAVQHSVLKFSSAGTLVGSYTVGDPNFTPTDVAVWRLGGAANIPPGTPPYAIAVSDRSTSQVYLFDALLHLGTGTYALAFGAAQLFHPEGLSIDDSGVVWVASTGNHRVYAFSLAGNVLTFGTEDYFIDDASRSFRDVVSVDYDGVYVVDATPSAGALLRYSYGEVLLSTYGLGSLQCPESLDIQIQLDSGNLFAVADPSPAPFPIPALSPTDLVALTVLLLGWGSLMLYRRAQGYG